MANVMAPITVLVQLLAATQRRGGRRSPLQAIFYWLTIAFIWIAFFGVAFIGFMAIDLPDISSLDQPNKQPSITYLDRSGRARRRARRQSGPRRRSRSMTSPITCRWPSWPSKDRRFFTHPGFDPVGMGRAVLRNLTKRKGANLAGVRPSPSSLRVTSSSAPTRTTSARFRN